MRCLLGVPRMCQGCFKCVSSDSGVSQGCLKGILRIRMSPGCPKLFQVIPKVFKKCFEGLSRVFQKNFRGVLRVFQRSFKGEGRYKYVFRKFQGV